MDKDSIFYNYVDLLYWIQERQRIYVSKTEGKPTPWTKDTTLRDYRFCNVYRENDRVTVWIRNNWRRPNLNETDLWFAMVVARLFNLPSTLEKIGYPVPFDPEKMRTVCRKIKDSGQNVFNAAYIVSTNGVAMDKIDYVIDRVLAPLWQGRVTYRPHYKSTLQTFFDGLNKAQGMGKFMSAQVVADMKYTPTLADASDWWTFAEPGPGSLKGMRYLLGLDMTDTSCDKYWKTNLEKLRIQVNDELKDFLPEPLHAQDMQNCLCELSKWAKVNLNIGRPKQKYIAR